MYNITQLDNGLRVVTEHIPYVKSVSVGIWVGAGAVTEAASVNGVSHFIEHMLFKGTDSRNCKMIAEEIDDIGGALNAFTSKDCTCYYIKALSEHLCTSIELLSDMIFNSLFAEEDIRLEKNVVLEEISMNEDSPEDLIHDVLYGTIFRGSSLGMPILGTAQTIDALSRGDIMQYLEQMYNANNTVISIVGNYDHGELMDCLHKCFGKMRNSLELPRLNQTAFTKTNNSMTKDIEQLHIMLGYQSFPRTDDRRYALQILNYIVGGSMSSRLFQTVREQYGLAYSIYTQNSAYRDIGISTVYVALNPSNRDDCIGLIEQEIAKVKAEGITDAELSRCKQQLKSSFVLAMESTSARMSAYGQSLLLNNFITDDEEKLRLIDNVTIADVTEVAEAVYAQPSIITLGQFAN